MARQSYVIIFNGPDGEPSPHCVEAPSPSKAVYLAIREFFGDWDGEAIADIRALYREWRKSLHGVYPGTIGYRVLA